jgi:thiol-disulfide isomerase/thioredoxin
MFGRPTGPTGPTTTTSLPTQAQQPITSPSSLLQSVSNRATGGSSPAVSAPAPDSGYGTPSTSGAAAALSSSSPLHPSTNPSSFRSLLSTHRAVVAMFTSATCAPCRMIEPVFEDLARSKKNSTQAVGQFAFVKVDLGVGMGSMVAREYGVTATPTFGFFLDGKKVRAARLRS